MAWWNPRTWRGPSTADAVAAALRAYQASEVNRLTLGWASTGAAADVEVMSSLPKMRARARQLDRDNPWASGIRKTLVDNVIGRTGIQPRPKVRLGVGPKAKLDKESNWRINDAYWRWAKAQNCDFRGMNNITALQRLWTSTWFQGGEALIRKQTGWRLDAEVDLQLEILEGDHLDHTLNRPRGEGENRIIAGVEVNGFGRPVAYHLLKKHPGAYLEGGDREHVRVPASDIIHLFIPTRAGQTRGVPEMHSVMRRMHDIDGYEEAERVAARVAAAKLGFFYVENADGPKADTTGKVKLDGKAGSFIALPEGYKFQGWDPQHPNSAYDMYMMSMLRGLAAGVGMSAESVTRDYSRTSFSSARTALLPERDLWRCLQEWQAESAMVRIFGWWLDAAHRGKNGVFVSNPLPMYLQDRERLIDSVVWRGRSWPWIDPYKDILAKKEELAAGLTSLERIYDEQGLDFEEEMESLHDEAETLERLGLKFDWMTSPEKKAAVDKHDEENEKDEAAAAKANGRARPPAWSFQ